MNVYGIVDEDKEVHEWMIGTVQFFGKSVRRIKGSAYRVDSGEKKNEEDGDGDGDEDEDGDGDRAGDGDGEWRVESGEWRVESGEWRVN